MVAARQPKRRPASSCCRRPRRCPAKVVAFAALRLAARLPIKLLEEQLGDTLFDRPGRRFALNAAGEALPRAVEPALAQIDDGVRAGAAAAGGTQHPDIAIELHTSQQTVDRQREGSPVALEEDRADAIWFACPSGLQTRKPLRSLRAWLGRGTAPVGGGPAGLRCGSEAGTARHRCRSAEAGLQAGLRAGLSRRSEAPMKLRSAGDSTQRPAGPREK
jgi:hypothetical protein